MNTFGAAGLTIRDALVAQDALMALAQVCERDEPPGTIALWHRLASRDTASPKVWMDGYLAAFAISSGLRLATLDDDFKIHEARGLDVVRLKS